MRPPHTHTHALHALTAYPFNLAGQHTHPTLQVLSYCCAPETLQTTVRAAIFLVLTVVEEAHRHIVRCTVHSPHHAARRAPATYTGCAGAGAAAAAAAHTYWANHTARDQISSATALQWPTALHCNHKLSAIHITIYLPRRCASRYNVPHPLRAVKATRLGARTLAGWTDLQLTAAMECCV